MNTVIRPVADRDFFSWVDLFSAYGEHYDVNVTDETALRLWSWLTDAKHEQEALVAVNDDDELIGLAHFREFSRPLASSRGLYIDDLFVTESARNAGAGHALLSHLKELAAKRRLSVVRWVTAEDNETAQALYNDVATRTSWVTYDMEV